ncbi:MAG: hypothetical protein RMM98_07230 [Acidobacteriota bacterium]|nr:hypothetical protein [Blastocatellia bacterium]MDW8239390.1 hypothetical protein [Acidobacteriota bacterium]
MTIRLIKKKDQAQAKAPEVDKVYDEKELQRMADRLAKAWKVDRGSRLRDK